MHIDLYTCVLLVTGFTLLVHAHSAICFITSRSTSDWDDSSFWGTYFVTLLGSLFFEGLAILAHSQGPNAATPEILNWFYTLVCTMPILFSLADLRLPFLLKNLFIWKNPYRKFKVPFNMLDFLD